jgi:hypothetical protein
LFATVNVAVFRGGGSAPYNAFFALCVAVHLCLARIRARTLRHVFYMQWLGAQRRATVQALLPRCTYTDIHTYTNIQTHTHAQTDIYSVTRREHMHPHTPPNAITQTHTLSRTNMQ